MTSLVNNGWYPANSIQPAEGLQVLMLLESSEGEVVFDLGGMYRSSDGTWLCNNDWYEGDVEYDIKFWRPLPDLPDCYKEAHYELQ